ncbi:MULTISPECIES: glycosyltransferase family 4 protein [Novosphingobium]|uniref:Glycosyltransferase involved in cell wall bisynthesis n=1 Tax=Novosphingobium mathurense TaxID=428990 RepID=A0A1U6IBP1_9SPHN|nr:MULTISPECIES: glycosyltransferase family 4 protein [Novosphingobium]CDO35676.1 Glycosyltransferase [Novosphingobium sp. KN65.2]SLK05435.1 Glycosyltransferase involved in cell wall bisynthesis [Novosphingobium mathurense]
MKIFVTGLRGMPRVMGGIESHCEELLPRIKSANNDLDINVLCRAPYVDPERRTFESIALTPLPAPRSRSFEAIVATFVATLYAWFNKANVLHIHGIGPALMTPLARLLGLKVIVTHHGADYERAKWGKMAKMILRVGERSGLIWADRVIAISPSLADHLREIFPSQAHKVSYIPNGTPKLPSDGVDVAEIHAALGLTGKKYAVAVGRLVPEKGLHDLIKAFQSAELGDDWVLAIAGDADHDSEYARELRSHESERIRFLGFQTRPVLKCLYDNCALFVMPSYHEGLPIAALEAASCEAPMLLSDIQANRDLGLGDDCYFPVGDVERLSNLLATNHKARSSDSRTVKKRFDWDAAAFKTAALYRSVAAIPNGAVSIARSASRSAK